VTERRDVRIEEVGFTAKRANGTQKRNSYSFPQGRVADRTFAWDDLV